MQLRRLNVGCFGGGTGLPSLLGGLKTNPWLQLHAVVTMFDSGGSSGQLREPGGFSCRACRYPATRGSAGTQAEISCSR